MDNYVTSILQNRFVLSIVSLCIALVLAFAVLPNVLSNYTQVYKAQNSWLGSTKNLVASNIEGFDAPTKAQASGLSGRIRFPKLSGRVVDNADLLNSTDETKLIAALSAHEKKSSDQIVVATINSLRGENLEEYSNLLFREWKLGQAGENNGVLLLVSKEDRKIRIEVGYGLEGTLTDAKSKLIIDNIIVPKFKTGNFSRGIVDGANMIVGVLEGDAVELRSRAKRNFQSKKDDFDWFKLAFIIIWGTLFFGPLALSILAPMFGEKLGPGHYKWLGIEIRPGKSSSGSSGSGGGFSGGGGGFSGGGGSSGGGGASGGW